MTKDELNILRADLSEILVLNFVDIAKKIGEELQKQVDKKYPASQGATKALADAISPETVVRVINAFQDGAAEEEIVAVQAVTFEFIDAMSEEKKTRIFDLLKGIAP